jgi:CheY-like chemotaxis protein
LIARKSLLQELGYNISTATGGDEALELFSKQNFDVVVTDFKMPRMDGIELIKRIRERAARRAHYSTVGICGAAGFDRTVHRRRRGDRQERRRSRAVDAVGQAAAQPAAGAQAGGFGRCAGIWASPSRK